MANLFGLGNSKSIQKYTGVQIQTSALGVPICIGYGKNMIAPNVIWLGDFKKHKQSAGKGGGKGGSYTYSTAVVLALGEGVISAVPTVYVNQGVSTLAALGFSLITGTISQAPWSYLTTNHSAQALSYTETAILVNPNYNLGSSPTLPSHQFECVFNLSGTMPGTADVNLADVIPDFLTNVQYGMGMDSSNIDSTTLANFKNYQQAQGLFFSPILTSQEKAMDIVNRWAILGNSWIYWSGDVIKFVPLGDVAITANGATYTPNTTVCYDLGPADFLGTVPIDIDIVDPGDAYNKFRVECRDRSLKYNSSPQEYKDENLIGIYGVKDNSISTANEICDPVVGKLVATLNGQRASNILHNYKFKTNFTFLRLEPGDVCTLTDPNLGLSKWPVRITHVDCDENFVMSFEAEEYPGILGIASPPGSQGGTPGSTNPFVDPGNANVPCVFEPNSTLAGKTGQIWMTASGGQFWGGADVYVSGNGGTSYTKVGTIFNTAPQGKLTGSFPSHADPDTTNTLHVDMSESLSQIQPVTHADADAFRTLSYISAPPSGIALATVGELVAYGTVTSTGTYTDDLTYIRRALYGTAAASHSTNDLFSIIDISSLGSTLFDYPVPPQYVGTTIHIKLVSFNIYGNAYQDISTVPDYTYAVQGTGFGSGTGGTLGAPGIPTGLSVATGVGANTLTWNANPVTDNVLGYLVYRATGTGASFGSSTQIGQAGGGTTHYIDNTAVAGQGYTYFIAAANLIGFSGPTAGVSTTTIGSSAGSLRPNGGTPGRKPNAGEELFNITLATGDRFPWNGSGGFQKAFLQIEQGSGGVAPTSSWTLTIKKNGTTVATGTIAGGATVGSFSGLTGDIVGTDGDTLTGTCITPQDTTCQGVSVVIFGSRTQ